MVVGAAFPAAAAAEGKAWASNSSGWEAVMMRVCVGAYATCCAQRGQQSAGRKPAQQDMPVFFWSAHVAPSLKVAPPLTTEAARPSPTRAWVMVEVPGPSESRSGRPWKGRLLARAPRPRRRDAWDAEILRSAGCGTARAGNNPGRCCAGMNKSGAMLRRVLPRLTASAWAVRQWSLDVGGRRRRASSWALTGRRPHQRRGAKPTLAQARAWWLWLITPWPAFASSVAAAAAG